MTRGVCVCGRVGYTKCTVHGDPVKGVGVTDGEFRDLIVRNKGAVLEILESVVVSAEKLIEERAKRTGRPRKGGAR